jgi:pimeloyl-ACP methyl ester carboxylesterase
MPLQVPETRYAQSGDVSIAYQVTGQGPFDLVFIQAFPTHVELVWTLASFAPTLERLGSFCRLIRLDKRGTGMSDRVTNAPNLEMRMDDVRAVMEAAGSERAVLFGSSEGGPMSLLFAATYPDRTAALVLSNSYPRAMWAPDYPWGWTEQQYRDELERGLRMFGPREQAAQELQARMNFDDEAEAEQWVNFLRWSGSPGAVRALAEMNQEIDVRHVLPAIQVPTLIVHWAENPLVPVEVARYMAGQISGSRLVELQGGGHLSTGAAALRIASEVESFVTDIRTSDAWEEPEPDRVLATVLFTDLVGSTAKATELGDLRWRELLEQHHARIRAQLSRYRGVELDTAGDGFFARFDGPARAIRCACAIREGLADLGLEIRAGLHTGECELLDGKVAGISVSIGARVAAQAAPGEVLVSQTVKDLVAGSGLEFEGRGAAELKGVPGEWRLYAVSGS